MQCPCCKLACPAGGTDDFQRGVDLKDAGLVTYRHLARMEDMNPKSDMVNCAVDTTEDVFILHSPKDRDIKSPESVPEIGNFKEQKNMIKCPRCRKIKEHAEKLLQKGPTLDINDVKGICDHCKIKIDPCCNCQEVVKKFLNAGNEKRIDLTKERVKQWLIKIRQLLLVPEKGKEKKRAFSELQIDQLFRESFQGRMREPGVDQFLELHELDLATSIRPSLDKKKLTHFKSKGPVVFSDPLQDVIPSTSTINDWTTTDQDSRSRSHSLDSKTMLHSRRGKEKEEVIVPQVLHHRTETFVNNESIADFDQIFNITNKDDLSQGLDAIDSGTLAVTKQHFETKQANKGVVKIYTKSDNIIAAKESHDSDVRIESETKVKTLVRKYNSAETLVPIIKENIEQANLYIFPKLPNKDLNEKQISSSELIKKTQDKLAKAEEARRAQKEERKQKFVEQANIDSKQMNQYIEMKGKQDELQNRYEGNVSVASERSTTAKVQNIATTAMETKGMLINEAKETKRHNEAASAKVFEILNKLKENKGPIDKDAQKAETDDAKKTEKGGQKANKALQKSKKNYQKSIENVKKVSQPKTEKYDQKSIVDAKNAQKAMKDDQKAKKYVHKDTNGAHEADKDNQKPKKDPIKAENMINEAKETKRHNEAASAKVFEILNKLKENKGPIDKDAQKAETDDAKKTEKGGQKANKALQKSKKNYQKSIQNVKKVSQPKTEKYDQKSIVDAKNAQKAMKDDQKAKKYVHKDTNGAHEADKDNQKPKKDPIKAENRDGKNVEKDVKNFTQSDKNVTNTDKGALKVMKEVRKPEIDKNITQQVIKDSKKKVEKSAKKSDTDVQKALKQAEKATKDSRKAEKDGTDILVQISTQKEHKILDKLANAMTKNEKEEDLKHQAAISKAEIEKKAKGNADNKDKLDKAVEKEHDNEKVDLNMHLIKANKSTDDLILKLVEVKQPISATDRLRSKLFSENTRITKKDIVNHTKLHRILKSASCNLCLDSDLELDAELIVKAEKESGEVSDIIIGPNIYKLAQIDEVPEMSLLSETKYEIFTENQESPQRKPPEVKTKPKMNEGAEPKSYIRYALSDRTFIDKGWTMLPTEKVVRKMNVYRMRPAHPEYNWFERNKNKGQMQYDSGETLAEFIDNGRARWFYRNGRTALDYYDAEELNAGQRFVIYSNGEPDERGRSRPYTLLATFDYLGNGIVFDHGGKIRLKYNQTEGVVLDRSIGPVSHWKWHTLNDPPVLQQVMIDTQMAHKDPNILKMGGSGDSKPKADNEDMLAIEFDNFIKEKSKKLSQSFKPFQIKMKALKINEHFSLKVLDQATVYLIFRDGTTNLKLNLGMLLDHKEIVDTDTAEVGEVSSSIEKLPARTESLAGMQKSIAYAQHYDRMRTERERKFKPSPAIESAEKLVAGISRPLRPPLTAMSGATSITVDQYKCRRKASATCVYYDTRLC